MQYAMDLIATTRIGLVGEVPVTELNSPRHF